MRTNALPLCAGLWTLVLIGGFVCLLKYEGTPGARKEGPPDWPRDTKIARTPGAFTLIMAAHPRCPCTGASIEELAKVLERRSIPVDVRVLFFKPAGADWPMTNLFRQAGAISGVRTDWDEDGMEAARFGAHTSGHVLLFDPAGKLLFSGGVTSGRGHAGPSKGNLALAAWLTPGESGELETLVFGCPITDPQSNCTRGNKACQSPQ